MRYAQGTLTCSVLFSINLTLSFMGEPAHLKARDRQTDREREQDEERERKRDRERERDSQREEAE